MSQPLLPVTPAVRVQNQGCDDVEKDLRETDQLGPVNAGLQKMVNEKPHDVGSGCRIALMAVTSCTIRVADEVEVMPVFDLDGRRLEKFAEGGCRT